MRKWTVYLLFLFVTCSAGHLIRNRRQVPAPASWVPESFVDELRQELGLSTPPPDDPVDQPFQRCRYQTLRGYCRHIQYCPLPEYRESNQTFRRHACILKDNHIGVCCPNSFHWNLTAPSPDNTEDNDTSLQAVQEIPQSFLAELRSDLGLGKPAEEPVGDFKYQACLFKGNRGYCRHVEFCPLADYARNQSVFRRHFCIIEKVHIGVCCPNVFIRNLTAPLPPPESTEEEENGTVTNGEEEAEETIPESFVEEVRKELGLAKPSRDPLYNGKYQSCLFRTKRGNCRHVKFCPLAVYAQSLTTFRRHSCIIEGKHIGVCCPHDFTSRLPPGVSRNQETKSTTETVDDSSTVANISIADDSRTVANISIVDGTFTNKTLTE